MLAKWKQKRWEFTIVIYQALEWASLKAMHFPLVEMFFKRQDNSEFASRMEIQALERKLK